MNHLISATNIDFDKLQGLILENQALRDKNKELIEERRKLISENNNLKIKLKKMSQKNSSFDFELISEHKGSIK